MFGLSFDCDLETPRTKKNLTPTVLILASAFLTACQNPTLFHSKNVYQRAWPTMATTFEVQVWHTKSQEAEKAMEAAFFEVDQVDKRISTYRLDSEVSKINQRAGSLEFTKVHPMTLKLVQTSLDLMHQTQNQFDITMGPLVHVWKMNQAWKGEATNLPPQKVIEQALALVNFKQIDLDKKQKAIYLEKPGMQLNFGAVAKGFALDIAAQKLLSFGVSSAKLRIGDQFLFVGKAPDSPGWQVGVRHPIKLNTLIGRVKVRKGSVSTSAGYGRYFIHKGQRYSHILNPKTGWPVSKTLSVTVWAKTATEADAWSTALFVMGPTKGKAALKKHPDIGAAWISQSSGKNLNPLDVYTVNSSLGAWMK